VARNSTFFKPEARASLALSRPLSSFQRDKEIKGIVIAEDGDPSVIERCFLPQLAKIDFNHCVMAAGIDMEDMSRSKKGQAEQDSLKPQG